MRDTQHLRVYTKPYTYLDASGEPVSLSLLEGDILRHLWDAGEAQSVVALYGLFYDTCKQEQREMFSPIQLAKAVSDMVQKGLLSSVLPSRQPGRGRGKTFYAPTLRREEVLPAVLDAVSRHLTGQPLGYFLARLDAPPEDGRCAPLGGGSCVGRADRTGRGDCRSPRTLPCGEAGAREAVVAGGGKRGGELSRLERRSREASGKWGKRAVRGRVDPGVRTPGSWGRLAVRRDRRAGMGELTPSPLFAKLWYRRLVCLCVPVLGALGLVALARWVQPSPPLPLLWTVVRWGLAVWCYASALVFVFMGVRIASGKDG